MSSICTANLRAAERPRAKARLVVYCKRGPEVLYKRIKKRDKKYERKRYLRILTEVAQAYNQFFFYYEETLCWW